MMAKSKKPAEPPVEDDIPNWDLSPENDILLGPNEQSVRARVEALEDLLPTRGLPSKEALRLIYEGIEIPRTPAGALDLARATVSANLAAQAKLEDIERRMVTGGATVDLSEIRAVLAKLRGA